MAKMLSVKVDIMNTKQAKATLGILKAMFSDDRIDFSLKQEYIIRYENLIKQLEFEEYCENASESHKELV